MVEEIIRLTRILHSLLYTQIKQDGPVYQSDILGCTGIPHMETEMSPTLAKS